MSVDLRRLNSMVVGAVTGVPAVQMSDAYGMLAGVALAIVGGFVFKKHRVLGVLGGLSLGNGGYQIATGRVGRGLLYLMPVAAGIGGSLMWKKHPAWGYILPTAGVGVATAMVVK